jgi:hypothetical protein
MKHLLSKSLDLFDLLLTRFLVRSGNILDDKRYSDVTCPQKSELLAYLENRLTGTCQQSMEAHLAACPKCRRKMLRFFRS